jgi:hypothetical protein
VRSFAELHFGKGVRMGTMAKRLRVSTATVKLRLDWARELAAKNRDEMEL